MNYTSPPNNFYIFELYKNIQFISMNTLEKKKKTECKCCMRARGRLARGEWWAAGWRMFIPRHLRTLPHVACPWLMHLHFAPAAQLCTPCLVPARILWKWVVAQDLLRHWLLGKYKKILHGKNNHRHVICLKTPIFQ